MHIRRTSSVGFKRVCVLATEATCQVASNKCTNRRPSVSIYQSVRPSLNGWISTLRWTFQAIDLSTCTPQHAVMWLASETQPISMSHAALQSNEWCGSLPFTIVIWAQIRSICRKDTHRDSSSARERERETWRRVCDAAQQRRIREQLTN